MSAGRGSAQLFGLPRLGERSPLGIETTGIVFATWKPSPDLRQQSTNLNQIVWRMRRVVDRLGGTGLDTLDPSAVSDRFFSMVERALPALSLSRSELDPEYTVASLAREIHAALPSDAIGAHTAVDVLAAKAAQ